ncbi:hypothetical protein A3C98_05165 [Candidatus Roizmanbacteria bacterium RIFCSPHIGHO2_02_FULL_37_15]|uniref:Uncharacterized protein n=1 Tax=Candidatus Roizmanbacteria bacterium RIFCSPLOWO2_01_FULL_37_16 TaxID=1802058 RepID=A0A1F7IPW2_9BACT|nr:MAG: hypothetical protein A2859_00660 [Candidatus Roizmanbacteria bacterium RIFCSPHIGHO2_01_FULL_37_16b]OGK20879.1 MAG: hypothetical protein A3C98_05165 [Candidatus Roizmanbacteria bacterium RIFCSPHIGHO2_02_FULL_37_15]OGK32071.1 MAG: hypothetical protein A3F57_04770 [Candidatus Roizmanbacteria bacterium RIFCSPHIGHO2_12_FULL_36_11]OGK45400.1 MAG: hypothetical protein A3B40_02760 [Candidatus Roizmanbacteria bacterium RIFCSPLOWO2_01_FULL_37_16]OGK57772.1 MAG: hypothetical protein A3I50_04100 [C
MALENRLIPITQFQPHFKDQAENPFASLQVLPHITAHPYFPPALDAIRERTKAQRSKGLLTLDELVEVDPRDPLIAGQIIQTTLIVREQISQLQAEDRGGIIMVMGGMGAGKTTAILRTAQLLNQEKIPNKIFCNSGELGRFNNQSEDTVKSADGLSMPVATTDRLTEIEANPKDVMFLVEALFQLYQEGNFDEKGFEHLLELANSGTILVIDSLAYFSTTAPVPMVVEFLTRLAGIDITFSNNFLFAKCSLDPERLAVYNYPLYRQKDGEINLCPPTTSILEVTDTADPKPGGFGFLPVSEVEYLKIAREFDPDFQPADDSIFWQTPTYFPLQEALENNSRSALPELLAAKFSFLRQSR